MKLKAHKQAGFRVGTKYRFISLTPHPKGARLFSGTPASLSLSFSVIYLNGTDARVEDFPLMHKSSSVQESVCPEKNEH